MDEHLIRPRRPRNRVIPVVAHGEDQRIVASGHQRRARGPRARTRDLDRADAAGATHVRGVDTGEPTTVNDESNDRESVAVTETPD